VEDIAIYSLKLNKTISAGEGGAVTTNDPVLFERAGRFHDVGSLRGPHEKLVGKPRLEPFVGCNFRMSEFTGGVLLAQTRKLDTIVAGLRAAAGRVYAGIGDLQGIKLRHRPDPEGELGVAVFIGFNGKDQRDAYMAALEKEGIPSAPPVGSVILPIQPYIEKKVTVHPAWPSFTSERGRQIQYGAACCPRTIDILNRFAGVPLGPKFAREDTDEVVAAIRKVYPAIVRAT
jgi:8-amino-3,8-dideoxy-alpha-D-manno-octulosonate transaminase